MKVKIIEKAYFIFLLLLPFVYFSITVDPVLMPRQLYLSAFVLLVVLLLYFRKDNHNYLPLKNLLYLAIGSYLLLVVISTYGNFTAQSHYVLSKQLVVFSFLIVTIHALYNKIISMDVLIKGCIGIGIIAILGAYYHWIEKTIDGVKMFRRASLIRSFFANKNLLSSILFLCFPFFIMGLMQSRRVKIIAIVSMLTALPILIVLGTRAVFLAFAVSGLLVLCYYLNLKYGIRKRFIGFGSSVLVVLSILVYINFIAVKTNGALSKNTATQYFQRISSSKTLLSRAKFWDNSIAVWKEKPFLGVGMGHWQVQFPKYGLDKFDEFNIVNGTETLQRPHNDFLNILCENGLLGLLAYCLIFGVIYYQLLYLIRNTKAENEKWNFIYILAGITGYIVISFFDFPMERIEHQILLMILFGITTSNYYSKKVLNSEPKIEQTALIYGITAFSLYAFIVAGFRLKGETETTKMYAAKANERWSETLFHANRAENYFYTTDQTGIPIAWYKGLATANLNETNQSVAYFESAYQKAPYQIQVINNLASSYEFQGNRKKAKEYFLRALQISSGFEEARLNLAALYYNEKQYDKAFDVIDKMNFYNVNPRYKKYLIRILSKKINLILIHENDLDLSRNLAKNVTKGYQLYKLYKAAKENNVSFEAQVLSLKTKMTKP